MINLFGVIRLSLILYYKRESNTHTSFWGCSPLKVRSLFPELAVLVYTVITLYTRIVVMFFVYLAPDRSKMTVFCFHFTCHVFFASFSSNNNAGGRQIIIRKMFNRDDKN